MSAEAYRYRAVQILLKDTRWLAEALEREKDVDLAPYLKQVSRDLNCVRDMDETYRKTKEADSDES